MTHKDARNVSMYLSRQLFADIRKTFSGTNIIIALFAVTAILLTMTPSSAKDGERVYRIRNGVGGKIARHYEKFSWVNREFDRVEIIGLCKSACTMILGIVPLNRICIYPGARIGFHAAYGREGRGIISAKKTAEMASAWDPRVYKWVMEKHALDSFEYTWVKKGDMPFLKRCKGRVKN